MTLPIDRLRADKFDESKINRDRKGRFSDKPGGNGPDLPDGGSSGGSSKRKKKTRGRSLPHPGPPPKPGDKAQVAEIEKRLATEAEAAAAALQIGVPTGNGFAKAKRRIEIVATAIATALDEGSIKEAWQKLAVEATKQIDKVAELDPKDYYEIPEAAFHYLHLIEENTEFIHHAVEQIPFAEDEDDAVMAIFREKDHPRDDKGRFRGLGGLLKRIGRAVTAADYQDERKRQADASAKLRSAGIEPTPHNNGMTRQVEPGPGAGMHSSPKRDPQGAVYRNVYTDPVTKTRATDNPDGSTTIKGPGGHEQTIPKPTPENTTINGRLATVSGRDLAKRDDGAWEDSEIGGPVGPDFAKALDRLLADSLGGDDGEETPADYTGVPNPKTNPRRPKRRLGLPVAPQRAEQAADVFFD
jgi:hypothetical protein